MTKQMIVCVSVFVEVPMWFVLPSFLDHVNVCVHGCMRVCRYKACRHTPRALRLLSRSLVAMETVWVGRMPQGIRRAHRGHKFKGHVRHRQRLHETKNNSSWFKMQLSFVMSIPQFLFCSYSLLKCVWILFLINGIFQIKAKIVSMVYLYQTWTFTCAFGTSSGFNWNQFVFISNACLVDMSFNSILLLFWAWFSWIWSD